MSEIIIVIEDEEPIDLVEVAEQGPPGPPGPPGDGEGSGTASAITFEPAGTIAASNVQAAIEELDNDDRMSNARTPSAHKSSHASGGSDALTPSDIGAQPAGSYVTTSDSRLTDSREWSAETVSQAEAEAGTATTRRAWTALRIWQAIGAWWETVGATKADSSHTHISADITDASEGGNGVADAGKLAKFNADARLFAAGFSTSSGGGEGTIIDQTAIGIWSGTSRTFLETAATDARFVTFKDEDGTVAFMDDVDIKLTTDPTGITGASAFANQIYLTDANYIALATKNANTLYVTT